jgi:hypothetical protein
LIVLAFFSGLQGDHPAGVLIAMCDGSVRFLTKETKQLILRALATRAGDEVIGAHW